MNIPLYQWLFLALFFLLDDSIQVVDSLIPCYSIFDCEVKVGPRSECIDQKYCSNPYHHGGCLANHDHKHSHNRQRTCNSEDPPESIKRGLCRPSPMGYAEIRLASQNWESVFFSVWILQILLGEILHVPVTVETGVLGKNVDFYDRSTRFEYGTSNTWDSLTTSYMYQDCRKLQQHNHEQLRQQDNGSGGGDYRPCAHVIPEVWTGYEHVLKGLQENQTIERSVALGALGGNSWYVPLYTIHHDPSLATFVGLQGEENRRKLAETFLRPTTWQDYCLYESEDQCQTPDSVAPAGPPPEGEEGRYFAGTDRYTGFFRNTTYNDCDAWPHNCTGHIVDFPCGWTGFVEQQAYYNEIAVQSDGDQPGSGGYTYSEMTQIWAAANATKSHVLMLWWEPEALYQEYIGTDAEFQRINLPPPTQKCAENRVTNIERCSLDQAVRVGEPEGACADYPHALMKVIGSSLFDISHDPNVPEPMHSPAYETIKNFRITNNQLGQIFEYWFEIGRDKWNLDPRDAVCRWVIENLEELESFIPQTHPRVVEDDDEAYDIPIVYAALSLSVLAMVATVTSFSVTYIQREKRIIRYAQVEFLMLLLFGLLLVSTGGLLSSLPPTSPICVSIVWLINLGYTLQLVPLIVKVAAVNRLMVAAQRMRRVELSLYSLYGAVAGIALFMMAMLTVWTVTYPPQKSHDLTLTDTVSETGETVVQRTYYCESENKVWEYLAVSWQVLLLIACCILAFQTRKIRLALNETRTLAMLVYSQFVFVVLRALTLVLESSINQTSLAASRSIIYNCDVLATISIYFLPKFFQKESNDPNDNPWISTHQQQSSYVPSPSTTNKKSSTEKKSVHVWKSSALPSINESDHELSSSDNDDDDNNDISHANGSSYAKPVSFVEDTNYRTHAEWENSDEDEAGLPAVSEGDEDDEHMEIVFVDGDEDSDKAPDTLTNEEGQESHGFEAQVLET